MNTINLSYIKNISKFYKKKSFISTTSFNFNFIFVYCKFLFDRNDGTKSISCPIRIDK